jgi:cytochrome bd-type quinol oxidase subunit 1
VNLAAYPGLPNPSIPILGDKWAVGTFFLVHVAFGSFTMGTLVLGPTYELIGRLRGSAPLLRYARWLANINLRIFSVGATLAGFAVILLLGLYSKFFVQLVTLFWIPFLVAFLIWFPAIAALYVWSHWWDRMAPSGFHIAIGYFAAAMDHIFLFMIVGVDSYLLTPGRAGMGAFFNASFLVELGHRFVGNISWASFLLAGIAAVLAGVTRDAVDREYFSWAARLGLVVGFLTLIPQIAIGFVFAETLRHAQPAAFDYSFEGGQSWLWLVQTGLLSLLLLATNFYFSRSRPTRGGLLAVAVVLVLAVASDLPAPVYGPRLFWIRYVVIALSVLVTVGHWFAWHRAATVATQWRASAAAALAAGGIAALALLLVMGVIRTTARDPYIVYGELPQSQGQVLPEVSPGVQP